MRPRFENRIAERQANDRMITGMQAILGAFCLLLAAIGLANVFSTRWGLSDSGGGNSRAISRSA